MNCIYYTIFFFLALQVFCCAVVPVNITIPSGYKCIMSGSVIMSVTGNLSVNGTVSASGTSNVKFNGTTLQQIGGSSEACTFQSIELNNSANIKLLGDVIVNGTVTFTSGNLCTGINTLILSQSASFNPAEGAATKFVDGKIKKTGNGSSFVFPTGDIQGACIWAPIEISAWDNTNDFTAHYTYKSPYDSLEHPTWNTGSNLGAGLDHVSGKEFWLIDRTGAGSQVPNLTLYWKDAVKSDITCNIPGSCTDYGTDALDDLTLVHWNSGTSKWDDMGGTATGIWPTGQITNSIAFTSYSPITFGSKTGKNPLPIELLDFSATCNNNSVSLKWSTTSETNNSHFIIERSTDAHHWDIITTVQGSGNSNLNQYYSHTDTEVSTDETFYYRLGSIDYNGNIEYSNPISTNCIINNFNIVSTYPNPVINGKLQFIICTSDNIEIIATLSNVLGQKLVMDKYKIEKGITPLSIDVSTLASSIYFFKVTNAKGTYMDWKQLVIKN